LTVSDQTVTVDAAGLAALHPALARRVALNALETANPARSYGLEVADALCRLAASPDSCSVPGLRMERSGARVVLTRESRATRGNLAPLELVLQVPGEVSGPGWALRAEGPLPWPAETQSPEPGAQGLVVVDADRVGATLRVRTRQPGDRLKPVGAPGRKKVQDLFVDRKVPRDERDAVPIVIDASGEIVWVAGHALAEPFGPSPLTTTVVVLSVRRA
jgi:tRNA(Ile)-lysidine synthase